MYRDVIRDLDRDGHLRWSYYVMWASTYHVVDGGTVVRERLCFRR